jgi:ABC-type polysaccharide/polyol phosphate transport system ATPase subunit
MTPRENVRILSEVYGVSRENRNDFEKEVEDFCELGEAFDRKQSTLSSGMAGRVGFGFTTSLKPEILLMDETLGVGDEHFRKKATQKAVDFMERGETIILSTHSLNLAKNMCKRGIVLIEGRMDFEGSSEDAVKFYLESIE